MMIGVLAVLECIVLGVSDGSTPSAVMMQRLRTGLEKHDPRVISAVVLVLDDELTQKDSYNENVRQEARDVIVALQLRDCVTSLKKIAALTYRDSPEAAKTLDLIAITASLDALTALRANGAVDLNRDGLGKDPWIRAAAIRNLADLQDWESTGRIAEIVDKLEDPGVDLVSAVAAVSFVAQSPLADGYHCPTIEGGWRAYEHFCIKGRAPVQCKELSTSLSKLAVRPHSSRK